MRLNTFILATVLITSSLCNAQKFLNLGHENKSFLYNKPFEFNIDTAKINKQKPLNLNRGKVFKLNDSHTMNLRFSHGNNMGDVYISAIDNMRILRPDSNATSYFKPHDFMFNKNPSTVYYMPNLIKKTLLFEPKPSVKTLLVN